MKIRCEIWLILLLDLLNSIPVCGQNKVMVSLPDSLIVKAGTAFASSLLKIENPLRDSLYLSVMVNVPDGWQLMGKTEEKLCIASNDVASIPITLKRQLTAKAEWLPVSIVLRSADNDIDTAVKYYVRAEPNYKAQLKVKNDQHYISDPSQPAVIDLVIKNIGNASDSYSLIIKNDFIGFYKVFPVSLNAQQSVSLQQKIFIPKEKWPMLKTEHITIYLNSPNKIFVPAPVTIIKLANSIKENASAYETVKAQTEAGLMINGPRAEYYASIMGDFKLKDARFQYNYRTKQYGGDNNLYNNIFSLKILQRSWKLELGQLNNCRFFYGYGRGVNIEKNWGKESRFYIAGIIGDKYMAYAGNLLQGGLTYNLKKIFFNHDFAANSYRNIKSYLVNSNVSILRSKSLSLDGKFGIGLDKQHRAAVKDQWGLGWGYKMHFLNKKFVIDSRMSVNDNNFPGINKGAKDNMHSVSISGKQIRSGIFYSETVQLLNVFRDTVYNGDLLVNNSKRYGVNLKVSGKSGNYSLSAGKISGSILSSGLANYNYVEPSLSLSFFKALQLSVYSTIGYNSTIKYKNKPTIFNTSNFRLMSKRGGLNILMVSIPYVTDSLSKTNYYLKTFNIAPYVQFSLFKNLSVNLCYNWSKTVIDDRVINNINSTLVYSNRKKGIDITFNGLVPLRTSKVNALGFNKSYYSLTLRKNLNVPVPFSKKYHSLKLRLFEDVNFNQRIDAGERTLDSLNVKIDDICFQTNKKGEVEYRNIKKGNYQIDLSQTPKGFVPNNGLQQTVTVTKDEYINLPLVKSKVISGRIFLVLDSLSNIKFSVAGLKIMATDSLGNTFQSLANDNGDFYINVPSGFYKVSLNPDALDNTFKPDTLFFMKEVVKNEEVNFTIRQQKRKVRLLNTD